MGGVLAEHQHGKGRVRLGRVWREGAVHHMVEWTVSTMLESDMAHAFTTGSNKGMTATDTQKNMVYYVGKQCSSRCTIEEYATALGKKFVDEYPLVSKAKIWVEQAPWKRVMVAGQPHNHGFAQYAPATRTTYVEVSKTGPVEVTSGLKNFKVLKTTQSGYDGFLHDKYTLLGDTSDRIMATSITSTWKFTSPVPNYDAAYEAAVTAITETFYGPPDKGVFSPGVQATLYQMANAILAKVPQVGSVFFNLPNLHFLPCNPVTSKFDNDVYIATSEPHGDIEATVTRQGVQPHCKL
ncbi:hypothetical protein WJX72_010739 [[Myrmecia] bisecta]|uniref:Uricase n=1 Tax=[Myrmecia] bisecta TaxID=41462 RepID=A0AAW1Q4Q7_9CHLO